MTHESNHPDHPGVGATATARSIRLRSGPALTFDLVKEAERLRREIPWNEHGRNAVTLVKHSDLRIVFMVMKPGARLEEHHANARLSIHALEGHVRLRMGNETIDLLAGHLLALEENLPHDLEAIEESAVLLTIAWQGA